MVNSLILPSWQSNDEKAELERVNFMQDILMTFSFDGIGTDIQAGLFELHGQSMTPPEAS